MRVRKPLAAAAALGITAGLVGFMAPAQAGPAEVVFEMTCIGDDNVLAGTIGGSPADGGSQGVINLLGAVGGTGATSISLNAVLTPDVPATMTPGETAPASFGFSTVLEQSTIDAAATAGITAITVKNQTYEILNTGAASPASFVLNPPESTIDITADPIVYPDLEIGGDVTAVSEEPITNIIYQVGTVSLGVSVSTDLLGTVEFGMTCGIAGGAANEVARTAVEGGIDPTTTTAPPITAPPTTTTTAAPTTTAVSGTGSPRFTG